MSDGIRLIQIKEDILEDNTCAAGEIREAMKRRGTLLINLMSSPGSGKTTFLKATINALKGKYRIGVIEADIDSQVDAETITSLGVPAVQLQTGGFCHLDAAMVEKGVAAFGDDEFDVIFIENVGNLVCPAEFDTGATKNIMILSVPEGDDKPLKYPLMFTVSELLLVSKIDYLSLSDFSMEKLTERVNKLNSAMKILPFSALKNQGMEPWISWLEKAIKEQKGEK